MAFSIWTPSLEKVNKGRIYNYCWYCWKIRNFSYPPKHLCEVHNIACLSIWSVLGLKNRGGISESNFNLTLQNEAYLQQKCLKTVLFKKSFWKETFDLPHPGSIGAKSLKFHFCAHHVPWNTLCVSKPTNQTFGLISKTKQRSNWRIWQPNVEWSFVQIDFEDACDIRGTRFTGFLNPQP